MSHAKFYLMMAGVFLGSSLAVHAGGDGSQEKPKSHHHGHSHGGHHHGDHHHKHKKA